MPPRVYPFTPTPGNWSVWLDYIQDQTGHRIARAYPSKEGIGADVSNVQMMAAAPLMVRALTAAINAHTLGNPIDWELLQVALSTATADPVLSNWGAEE